MKVYFFFTFFSIFPLITGENLNLQTSKVISDVIEKLYGENFTFDILFYGTQTPKLKLICDKFLKLNRIIFPSKIYFNEDISLRTFLNKSTVIFTSSQQNFQSLCRNVELMNIYHKELKFLIYIEEIFELEIPKDLENNFYENQLRGQFYHYVYFLNEFKNQIRLATLESFTEKLCDELQIVTLNIFDKNKRKWRTNLEIPEKFQNFHNCTIVCGVYVNTQESYVNTISNELEGIVPNLMRAVAPKLNLSLILQMNKFTAENVVRPLNDIHLTPHLFVAVLSTVQMFFHISTPFDESCHIFVITPGEKYSSYEKLLLPFDAETWTYLAITFGVAFLTVFIVNLMPKNVQDLVYGKGINTPSFNIAGSFFGTSQRRVPTENFPRILLVHFVIFCLIFRTAYQGKKVLNKKS
jgi:hypothetical protein